MESNLPKPTLSAEDKKPFASYHGPIDDADLAREAGDDPRKFSPVSQAVRKDVTPGR
jgi:hypothetical protein